MIAVDTNILVYAHRVDSEWHSVAAKKLIALAESKAAWAIAWPCVHEFFAKVTHPKIFVQPSTPAQALEFIAELSRSPGFTSLAEGDGYFQILEQLVRVGRVSGPMIHDARIAALCLLHGVSALWTADRDFGRFPALAVSNPLVE
jgi:toxin-antitoxin system PIN domain toxin